MSTISLSGIIVSYEQPYEAIAMSALEKGEITLRQVNLEGAMEKIHSAQLREEVRQQTQIKHHSTIEMKQEFMKRWIEHQPQLEI